MGILSNKPPLFCSSLVSMRPTWLRAEELKIQLVKKSFFVYIQSICQDGSSFTRYQPYITTKKRGVHHLDGYQTKYKIKETRCVSHSFSRIRQWVCSKAANSAIVAPYINFHSLTVKHSPAEALHRCSYNNKYC